MHLAHWPQQTRVRRSLRWDCQGKCVRNIILPMCEEDKIVEDMCKEDKIAEVQEGGRWHCQEQWERNIILPMCEENKIVEDMCKEDKIAEVQEGGRWDCQEQCERKIRLSRSMSEVEGIINDSEKGRLDFLAFPTRFSAICTGIRNSRLTWELWRLWSCDLMHVHLCPRILGNVKTKSVSIILRIVNSSVRMQSIQSPCCSLK